jgi:hypothetical protein
VLPFPEEKVMNESTVYAQTSRSARASHTLGVLGLLLQVLSGWCILSLAACGNKSGVLSQDNLTLLSLGAIGCLGMAVVAALAALVLGILGLEEIRRGAGKIEGRGRAISGLVTATLTLLAPVVGCGLVALVVASR